MRTNYDGLLDMPECAVFKLSCLQPQKADNSYGSPIIVSIQCNYVGM
jgi:hypothetical protein